MRMDVLVLKYWYHRSCTKPWNWYGNKVPLESDQTCDDGDKVGKGKSDDGQDRRTISGRNTGVIEVNDSDNNFWRNVHSRLKAVR